MKSHKGMAKRVKITGTGKVTFKRAGERHLLTTKNAKRKRSLKVEGVLIPAEERMVKRLLPYCGGI
jgi:large subunit ribosomal protein L35